MAQFEEATNDDRFGGGSIDRRNQENSGNNKEIPVGLKVWQVDERFGDRRKAEPDTLSPMFMNTIFTTGLRGEYNTLGNLGSPRINRIFIDRQADGQFIFTQPYDFFIKRPQDFHFTNTLSPITNLTYNTCGDRLNGEDHFTAKFGVNVNKRLGFGANFDYIYGRGYYDSQSTSHFNYTLYGSYLGERYEAHLLGSLNHQKVAETAESPTTTTSYTPKVTATATRLPKFRPCCAETGTATTISTYFSRIATTSASTEKCR